MQVRFFLLDLDLDLDLPFLKRTWTGTWTCPFKVDLDLRIGDLDLAVAGLVTSLPITNGMLLFWCAKDLTQIRCTLGCIQCMATSVFRKPTVQVWCNKVPHGQKFSSDTEVYSFFRSYAVCRLRVMLDYWWRK